MTGVQTCALPIWREERRRGGRRGGRRGEEGGSSLLSSFIIVALLLRAGDEGTGRETELESEADNIKDASNVARGTHVKGHFGLNTEESGVLGRVALGHRLTILITFFTLLFAALIANLTYIQVVKAKDYKDMPFNQNTLSDRKSVV